MNRVEVEATPESPSGVVEAVKNVVFMEILVEEKRS
jgi:hypothetical protein